MKINENVYDTWEKYLIPKELRGHLEAVTRRSLEIAERLKDDGIDVNIDLVETGALLHDIGRVKEHGIKHGIVGYKILKGEGFSENICRIARNHIGSGISKKEATELGLPAVDFIPETLEQKVVSYADNLTEEKDTLSFEEVLSDWKGEFGPNSNQVGMLKLQKAELEDYITGNEMKKLEKEAVGDNISVFGLMENAGSKVFELAEKNLDIQGRKVVIFSGKGNNGGDSLVSAFYFNKANFDVEVLQFGEPKTKECSKNFEKVVGVDIPIKMIEEPSDLKSVEGDVAVDGLLGTGIKGQIKEPISSGIEKINAFEKKLAVDVPSGLDPDTGEEADRIVKPDLVITMHRFKKGLVGKYKLGKVRIGDIGI